MDGCSNKTQELVETLSNQRVCVYRYISLPLTELLHHRHRLSQLSGAAGLRSSGTCRIETSRFDRPLWSHGWRNVVPSERIVYMNMRSEKISTSDWDFAGTVGAPYCVGRDLNRNEPKSIPGDSAHPCLILFTFTGFQSPFQKWGSWRNSGNPKILSKFWFSEFDCQGREGGDRG